LRDVAEILQGVHGRLINEGVITYDENGNAVFPQEHMSKLSAKDAHDQMKERQVELK
jgi:hypothetical protein